jgi:hypothetical protein
MRRDGISARTVESIIASPDSTRVDVRGNRIAEGRDIGGRSIEVVTALDEAGYVITVIVRRKSR